MSPITTEDGTILQGSPIEIVGTMRDRSWADQDKSVGEFMEAFSKRMGLNVAQGEDDDARAEDFISILAEAGMVESQS